MRVKNCYCAYKLTSKTSGFAVFLLTALQKQTPGDLAEFPEHLTHDKAYLSIAC